MQFDQGVKKGKIGQELPGKGKSGIANNTSEVIALTKRILITIL